MGALEEASQRHVQGFGIKVSSFPSPGSSPTATRTTVNMLLTVLAITREVTLDRSVLTPSSWQAVSTATPRGTSEPLWRRRCSGVGRSTGTRLFCRGIPCMSPGRSWARDGSGARREDGVVEPFPRTMHLLLWFSWASRNKELHRKTNVPDVSCPHIIANSVSFPFSLLQSPFFSPWVTDSPSSSSSHGTALCCIRLWVTCRLDLLTALIRSNGNTRPDTTATHAQGVDRQDGWQAQVSGAFNIPVVKCSFWNTFKILNAQSRSSPSIHICLYIEILP